MGAGANGFQLLTAFALVLVPIITWSLTPAFAVAVFATSGRMGADGELIAASASGMGRSTLYVGPAILAFILFLISSWLWLAAAPRAHELLHREVSKMAGNALMGKLRENVFSEPVKGIVFFGEKRISPREFQGVLIEDARDKNRQMHYIAEKISFDYHHETQMISLKIKNGTAFVIPTTSPGPPVAIQFGELALTLDADKELTRRLDFLPSTLSYSTSRLMGKPPENVQQKDWDYALWRRIAGPIGLLAFSFLSIFVAFGSISNHIGHAAFRGAVLFLLYHLVARWGETLVDSDVLGPKWGAILPSAITGAFLGILALGLTPSLIRKQEIVRKTPIE